MAEYAVKIEHLDELQSALRQFPEIAEKHLQQAINEGVAIIREKSSTSGGIVPVRTSALSKSFGQGIRTGRLYGSIGPTVHYAGYVNDGTKRMKARRYMEKLEQDATPKINERFAKALDRIVNEIADKAS